jgi:hypothetical protein
MDILKAERSCLLFSWKTNKVDRFNGYVANGLIFLELKPTENRLEYQVIFKPSYVVPCLLLSFRTTLSAAGGN